MPVLVDPDAKPVASAPNVARRSIAVENCPAIERAIERVTALVPQA